MHFSRLGPVSCCFSSWIPSLHSPGGWLQWLKTWCLQHPLFSDTAGDSWWYFFLIHSPVPSLRFFSWSTSICFPPSSPGSPHWLSTPTLLTLVWIIASADLSEHPASIMPLLSLYKNDQCKDFPGDSEVRTLTSSAEAAGSIPGWNWDPTHLEGQNPKHKTEAAL